MDGIIRPAAFSRAAHYCQYLRLAKSIRWHAHQEAGAAQAKEETVHPFMWSPPPLVDMTCFSYIHLYFRLPPIFKSFKNII
jgi:hypothetical protein